MGGEYPSAAIKTFAQGVGQASVAKPFKLPWEWPGAMADDEVLSSVLKGTLGIVHTEDLLLEAVRDLVREEVKGYIRQRLEDRPALKEEMKQGVAALIEAKVREASALLLIAKSAAKLGVELVPAPLRKEVAKELVDALEKEITTILERTQ